MIILESLRSFFEAYPLDVLLIVALIVVAIYLMATNRMDALKKAALYAVTVAETRWGNKTGEIKYADVVNYLKSTFHILTLFLTDKQLNHIIESALIKMKEILATREEA